MTDEISNPNPDTMRALRELRGAGTAVFAELGGGEQFLRNERNEFYFACEARVDRNSP